MTRLLLAASVASLLAAAPALAQTTQAGSHLSSQDRAFVETAAQGGLAEVQAGQLAEQQAGTPAVREFGRWMVTDHTALNRWLGMIAEREGARVPTQPNQQQAQQFAQLRELRGAQFDQMYIPMQVQDHEKTVALFQQEAQSGENPRIKYLAQESIPMLEQHLAEAQELQGLLGSGRVASSSAR